MTRRSALATIAALAWALPAVAGDADAVIRAKAGPSEIVITTTSRLSGAIHSVKWFGKEFIDSADHGRQLQSAASFDVGNSKDFWPEAFNPTEAGSRKDGVGPRSTSKLLGIEARGHTLTTITQAAFWLNPGERSDKYLAKNAQPLSKHLITKQLTIGYKQYAHAIDYKTTFTVPKDEKHTLGQFEAVTGYMPAEFSKFYVVDLKAGRLNPISVGPGEQKDPVVLSTADGKYAMGVWSPDQPSKGYETIGYGRFSFAQEKVVKWNSVFRVKDPAGIRTGNHEFRNFVVVGSAQNVLDTIVGLSKEKEFQK